MIQAIYGVTEVVDGETLRLKNRNRVLISFFALAQMRRLCTLGSLRSFHARHGYPEGPAITTDAAPLGPIGAWARREFPVGDVMDFEGINGPLEVMGFHDHAVEFRFWGG